MKRGEKYFPKKLEKLKDCPDILYVLGNEKILNDFSIAIVGARNCSYDGKKFSRKISYELAQRGINIVSGLALGIDSASHQGCLEAKGKTIAVLGGGVKTIYPKENLKLYEQIIDEGGAIISEQLPYDPPISIRLRNRNRIISAISDGVIVIEARERSGSLVTARWAKKLNKKIFVIPGSISDYNYKGSNALLADGAKCIRDTEDVLKNYPKIYQKTQKDLEILTHFDVPKELVHVYELIDQKGKSIDEISKILKCGSKEIISKLTMLEMQDLIVQYPGKIFVRK